MWHDLWTSLCSTGLAGRAGPSIKLQDFKEIKVRKQGLLLSFIQIMNISAKCTSAAQHVFFDDRKNRLSYT